MIAAQVGLGIRLPGQRDLVTVSRGGKARGLAGYRPDRHRYAGVLADIACSIRQPHRDGVGAEHQRNIRDRESARRGRRDRGERRCRRGVVELSTQGRIGFTCSRQIDRQRSRRRVGLLQDRRIHQSDRRLALRSFVGARIDRNDPVLVRPIADVRIRVSCRRDRRAVQASGRIGRIRPLNEVPAQVAFGIGCPVECDGSALHMAGQSHCRCRRGEILVGDGDRRRCRVRGSARVGRDGLELVAPILEAQGRRIERHTVRQCRHGRGQIRPGGRADRAVLELDARDVEIGVGRQDVHVLVEIRVRRGLHDGRVRRMCMNHNLHRVRRIARVAGLVDREDVVGVRPVGQIRVRILRINDRVRLQTTHQHARLVRKVIVAVEQVPEQILIGRIRSPRQLHGRAGRDGRQVRGRHRRLVVHRDRGQIGPDVTVDVLGFELDRVLRVVGQAERVPLTQQISEYGHWGAA